MQCKNCCQLLSLLLLSLLSIVSRRHVCSLFSLTLLFWLRWFHAKDPSTMVCCSKSDRESCLKSNRESTNTNNYKVVHDTISRLLEILRPFLVCLCCMYSWSNCCSVLLLCWKSEFGNQTSALRVSKMKRTKKIK